MYQIIKFTSGADYCIPNGPAINSTIGTDINIITSNNRSNLGNFSMVSILFNISKTITANNGTAENGIVITDCTVMINSDIIM